MRAARYLGVAPWELEERSVEWRGRALLAQGIEKRIEDERRAKRGF